MSGEDNLTAVLYGINDLRLEQRPILEPNSNQVLLRIEAVGICGSDVHYLVNGRIGPFVVEKPMVIGHEASGTVVKVGKEVTNLKIGDRVAIEPGYGCRRCDYCKQGKYNLCLDMKFCATPPVDGNLCRYFVHEADFCFKLPKNMTLEEGALMEPLAVGVHACKRSGVTVGSIVLILGAGPIGLTTMLSAKAYGASKVIITDLVESRLSTAKSLGADYTILTKADESDADITKKIIETLGCQPNITMECSGVNTCIRVAIEATRSGGVAMLIGMGKPEMTIPLINALIREVDVKGGFRYCNDYPQAIEMVSSGKIDVKPLISHRYKIEDTAKAFETARTLQGNAIKVMIHVNPNFTN